MPKPMLRGELTDPRQRAAIEEAAAADYRLIRRWLEDVGLPFMALPGNHDLYEIFAGVFEGADAEREIDGTRLIAFWDREHAGHIPHRLGRERRSFEDTLAQADGRPQIHLQHFLIRPRFTEDYPYNYADAEDLAASIERSGRVVAVLSGHYHRGSFAVGEGGVRYSVAPAFCVRPHLVRVTEIDIPDRVEITDVAIDNI